MFLCHKCSGRLTTGPEVIRVCSCISSYVREWQVPLTESEAIAEAIHGTRNMIRWTSERNAPGDARHVEDLTAYLATLTAYQETTDKHAR